MKGLDNEGDESASLDLNPDVLLGDSAVLNGSWDCPKSGDGGRPLTPSLASSSRDTQLPIRFFAMGDLSSVVVSSSPTADDTFAAGRPERIEVELAPVSSAQPHSAIVPTNPFSRLAF